MTPQAPAAGWSARPRASWPVRRALVVMAVTVVVVALVETRLVVAAYPDLAVLLGGYVLIGAMTVLVGLLAWDRRPGNQSGMLIVVLGLIVMLAAAGNIGDPVVAVVGTLAGEAPVPALLHLVLAFPTGRLGRRSLRWVVAAGYAVAVVVNGVRLLFVPGPAGTPSGPLADAGIAATLRTVQTGLALAVFVVAAAFLVARVRSRRYVGAERRILAAVYLYGAAALLFFPLSAQLNRLFFHLDEVGLFAVQINVVASVPVVFAVAVLGGGFARTWGIEELATWLAAPEARRPSSQAALATALGDPSLQVLFPASAGPDGASASGRTWIDVDGRPVELPSGESGRAWVAVGAGSARVPDDADEDAVAPGSEALVVYDRAAVANPRLVAAAARVLALALSRDRLDAQLRASREDIRAMSARIVEAADAERRRIGQDLHDLVQSRLVLAAMHAAAAEASGGAGIDGVDGARKVAVAGGMAAVREDLDAAITALREVVQGIVPALLVERGLFAAVDSLLDRIPLECDLSLQPSDRPLPDAVAGTAYVIVHEALTNVVKHAGATRIRVHLQQRPDPHGETLVVEVEDDGSGGAAGLPAGPGDGALGLRGIADRVEALGGRLALQSAPGEGTRLRVELPCS